MKVIGETQLCLCNLGAQVAARRNGRVRTTNGERPSKREENKFGEIAYREARNG